MAMLVRETEVLPLKKWTKLLYLLVICCLRCIFVYAFALEIKALEICIFFCSGYSRLAVFFGALWFFFLSFGSDLFWFFVSLIFPFGWLISRVDVLSRVNCGCLVGEFRH